MTEQQVRHARRQLRRLMAFDAHLATFVVVIGGLALVNWIFSPMLWWMVFPAIGWGMVLAAHAASVFRDSTVRSAWEGRETRDLSLRDGRGAA